MAMELWIRSLKSMSQFPTIISGEVRFETKQSGPKPMVMIRMITFGAYKPEV